MPGPIARIEGSMNVELSSLRASENRCVLKGGKCHVHDDKEMYRNLKRWAIVVQCFEKTGCILAERGFDFGE